MAPTMLEELCKRIQHCCATLQQSRNKRNVGSCWLKSLTSFKLCTTTCNNIQQGVQTDATCNNQQCCVRLHRASPQLPPTNCRPFNPQYPHTNSPNWCIYISIKNKLREFDKILNHFLPADYFINSHNLFSRLCIDIV